MKTLDKVLYVALWGLGIFQTIYGDLQIGILFMLYASVFSVEGKVREIREKLDERKTP